jgi:hypothetical protein
MKAARATIALVFALGWFGARGAYAQSDEAPESPPAPPAVPCPEVDSIEGPARVFEYPAQTTDINAAEYHVPGQPPRPGAEGVNEIAQMMLDSLRPGCVPIRVVTLIGGADFDSRGAQFQNHVSVERALSARAELARVFDPQFFKARDAGEIVDRKIRVISGGIGAHSPVVRNPTTEAERRKNRFVAVRLVQFDLPPLPPPDTETGVVGESAQESPLLDQP